MPSTEAFPILSSPTGDKFTALAGPSSNENARTTRRRKSSGLGGEIRAGDTGPALATLDMRSPSPGTLKAQIDRDRKKPFSKRRKARTLFQQWKRYSLKHTWVTPLVMISVFLILFMINPTDSNPIYHFIFLSYPIPNEPGAPADAPIQYAKGRWDIAFVCFYIIVLTFTREFIMQGILRPMARRNGMNTKAKQFRFMEQMYTAIYFAFTGPAGLYVMSRTPMWYFNTRGMYEGFPHKTSEGIFKFYYLFQAAYWSQQAIVLLLGLEARRKDFKELVGHHIVSLALIALSYRFHFTHMGLGVFITHDISDFFLATSKTLGYIDHPFVGPYFVFFIGVWIYCRHYLNLVIIWSEFNEFKTVGPYVLDWATEQYKCELSHWISTALLSALQALNLFWLYYIFRIAYRFAFLDTLQDDRSDDDEEEEEESAALSTQKAGNPSDQKPVSNGQSTIKNAISTGVQSNGTGPTNRKENKATS